MGCEYRKNCFFAANGFSARLRVSELCQPLRRRSQGRKLFLPRAVSLDGFRAINVSRESPRHRNVLTVYWQQALPHGVQKQGGTIHSGRRKRSARLANLCRLCASLDCYRAAPFMRAIRSMSIWTRVCMLWTPPPSIFASRSFLGPSFVSTGGGEDAYAAGSARQYLHVYPHY